tara:strand:- start:33 stop:224 length:192 start_codon:yes stop_codon:yes gene_type:complete
MLNRRGKMRNITRYAITSLITFSSFILAQGITLPNEPSQAPIGGLGWLAALGGASAYKKLRKK